MFGLVPQRNIGVDAARRSTKPAVNNQGCCRERVSFGVDTSPPALLPMEELMESGTFKRFQRTVDTLLDRLQNVNITCQLLLEGLDYAQLPEEAMMTRVELTDLANESLKLKSMGAFNCMSTNWLVRLLSVLLMNMVDGTKVTPSAALGDVNDGVEHEVILDRVMRGIEASVTGLGIMTSVGMPKEVFLEDFIMQMVEMIKFQLTNTLFSEYDSVYRVANLSKNNQGSIKNQRAKERQTTVKPRWLMSLYNRLVDLVDGLAQLVSLQRLTDTILLPLSALAVAPFFVENIPELQLNALKLVTVLFSTYPHHRHLILEDIFGSLARLPSSKRNLRSYRLNSQDSIQMLTALALLLVQSVVRLPPATTRKGTAQVAAPPFQGKQQHCHTTATDTEQEHEELLMLASHDDALHISARFLTVFLQKCATKGEDDFRPVFENFVTDLLVAVNKPEWPAAETLLSLLGGLLVKRFNDKQVEQSMRVTSLDILGTVASKLRRDALSSRLSERDIDQIIRDGKPSQMTQDDEEVQMVDLSPEERLCTLQQTVLDFLISEEGGNHIQNSSAGRFYLVQWLKDCNAEAVRVANMNAGSSTNQLSLQNKYALFEKIHRFATAASNMQGRSAGSNHVVLGYEEACLVCRYLSNVRPFSQSFDVYLAQILKVLNEQSVAMRSKAMKCLAMVVEADPNILERQDIEKSVHARLLDTSTSVREAAIELIGKFVLVRQSLIAQYYPMFAERILDTGISVRKRVIKIFRDICLEQPDFQKVPDICVKMIRRINDEDGIKKLVNEVFQSMWFTPVAEHDTVKLLQKVANIMDVVQACRDTGYEWFENLLTNLLKKEDMEKIHKPVERACQQIVDTLVQSIVRLEEVSSNNSSSQRLVTCLSTLHLFTKIRPEVMVENVSTLEPYLSIKCATQADSKVLFYVTCILELTVPLMKHPGEAFLCKLEEDLVRLIGKQGMLVLESCVRCLSAFNKLSKNCALVRSCLCNFLCGLLAVRKQLEQSAEKCLAKLHKPMVLRALFTCGLFCRYFDFDSPDSQNNDRLSSLCANVCDTVFDTLMFFTKSPEVDVVKKALAGLGEPSILFSLTSFSLTGQWRCLVFLSASDRLHQAPSNTGRSWI